MNPLDTDLSQRLLQLRQQGLYRELSSIDSPQSTRIQINGHELLNFSSNDYLGLANHQALKEAAISAIERFGAGTGASRLICGTLTPHSELDQALASFKRTEAALAFSTGYGAALGTITALLRPTDVIILDKLVHASIVDAARLSGATLRVFRHNDLNHLEHLLRWARAQGEAAGKQDRPVGCQTLVVTESIFSMDGDHAPLREIVQLKNKYDAWLMVDEAHATGLYGDNRRGLAELLDLGGEIEIQMGTLGKAVGASGGYICGSRILIDYLINRARAFIFSTAPVPAAAAAAVAGLGIVSSTQGDERRNHLWRLVSQLAPRITTQNHELPSAIIPLHVGEESRAVEVSLALRKRGILIPAIRYPTVARGRARLRLTLTAAHTANDLDILSRHLAELGLFQN